MLEMEGNRLDEVCIPVDVLVRVFLRLLREGEYIIYKDVFDGYKIIGRGVSKEIGL